MFDNENFVFVVLDAQPTIALIGKQYQEQVIYESKLSASKSIDLLHSEQEIGPEIMHEYKLMNKGPSQFLRSELLLSWQRQIKIQTGFNTKNKDFLYLMELPYTEGPIKCQFNTLSINPLNLTRISEDRLKYPEKYYLETNRNNIKNEAKIMKKKRRSLSDMISDQKNKLLSYLPFGFSLKSFDITSSFVNNNNNINCLNGVRKQYSNKNSNEEEDSSSKLLPSTSFLSMSQEELYDFYCSALHCTIGPLSADESALIRLRFRLWSRNLAIVS
jgi:hypothetical protein